MNPNSGVELVNSYALVSYLPHPLGGFLDELRHGLVPGCRLRSHVTFLPPRPLAVPDRDARRHIAQVFEKQASFEIELGNLEIFPRTQVIYLSLVRGGHEMERLHNALNQGDLAYEEPFEYHPHVTLAQDFPLERLDELAGEARRRWREWPLDRGFTLETAYFVRNTLSQGWLDLATYDLKAQPAPLSVQRLR